MLERKNALVSRDRQLLVSICGGRGEVRLSGGTSSNSGI